MRWWYPQGESVIAGRLGYGVCPLVDLAAAKGRDTHGKGRSLSSACEAFMQDLRTGLQSVPTVPNVLDANLEPGSACCG